MMPETAEAPITVEAIRESIAERLEELRPLVAEAAKLEGALEALEAQERPRRGRPPKK